MIKLHQNIKQLQHRPDSRTKLLKNRKQQQ